MDNFNVFWVCLTIVLLALIASLTFSEHLCQDQFIKYDSVFNVAKCDFNAVMEPTESPQKGFICHCKERDKQ